MFHYNFNNGNFNNKDSAKSNVDSYYKYKNSSDGSNGGKNCGWWNSLGWKWQLILLITIIVIWNLLGGR